MCICFCVRSNHLFVLNFGINDGFEGERVCPQKLLIFDLDNNRLVKRIIIPSNVANNVANNKDSNGLLATSIVNVPDCRRIDNATVNIFSDLTCL